jgi:hypothetical protein
VSQYPTKTSGRGIKKMIVMGVMKVTDVMEIMEIKQVRQDKGGKARYSIQSD